MRTIDEVFDVWPTLTEMASDVGWSRDAVEKWKERSRIPSDAWSPLILALRKKGKDLSSDRLLQMHSRARRSA